MKDYIGVAIEIIKEARAIGIVTGDVKDVVLNSRTKKRFGQCRRTMDRKTGKATYVIEIGTWMTDDNCPDWQIRNTMAHEVLHTCEGCMDHGALWHKYAKMMNDKYGYSIDTYVSKEESALREVVAPVNYKYSVSCKKCGYKIGKDRRCKIVTNPSAFFHKGCGGYFVLDI